MFKTGTKGKKVQNNTKDQNIIAERREREDIVDRTIKEKRKEKKEEERVTGKNQNHTYGIQKRKEKKKNGEILL